MPAPSCASCHVARASLCRPCSGQALCGSCFCAAFEAEVQHTVLVGHLLLSGAVAALGASGGKDSTVLPHMLRALVPRLGISLQLMAVDKGIRRGLAGGSQSLLKAPVGSTCASLGWSKAGFSSFWVSAIILVRGHNADDMVETVLMNFLRGGWPGAGAWALRARGAPCSSPPSWHLCCSVKVPKGVESAYGSWCLLCSF
nr:cytoplasmic tRNA 2-thiolation protein 1-like [Symphalangus syndactylus]